MTRGTLIKLREGRRRRLPTWTVEICQGDQVAYSHEFEARPEARQYARRVASERGAVVVLAGPDKARAGSVAVLPRGNAP